jgi:hypothetical protein
MGAAAVAGVTDTTAVDNSGMLTIQVISGTRNIARRYGLAVLMKYFLLCSAIVCGTVLALLDLYAHHPRPSLQAKCTALLPVFQSMPSSRPYTRTRQTHFFVFRQLHFGFTRRQ